MYVVGILAAIAIPAYQDYTVRAVLRSAMTGSQFARQQLTEYYLATTKIPPTLSAAGVDEQLPNGMQLSLNPNGMVLTLQSKRGALVFTPQRDEQGRFMWVCRGGEGVSPAQLPSSCR